MLSLKPALLIWSIAGPVLAGGAVYLAMLTREAIVVSGATRAARNEEVSICSEQRLEISRAIDANVASGTADARLAADGVAATPETAPEVAALCKASASCRERAN